MPENLKRFLNHPWCVSLGSAVVTLILIKFFKLY